VISSHVLSEVAQTVDQVVIMAAGSLRYAGDLGGLGGDPLETAFLDLTTTR
jgi:ABC-2 type transport system ATP-binding protein